MLSRPKHVGRGTRQVQPTEGGRVTGSVSSRSQELRTLKSDSSSWNYVFFFFFKFPRSSKKKKYINFPSWFTCACLLHVEKRNHRLSYRVITSEQSRLGSNGRCAAPTAAHAESSGVLESSALSKLPRPRHLPLSASEAYLPCCLRSVSALPICCLRGTTGTPRNHQCHTAFHAGRRGVCTLCKENDAHSVPHTVPRGQVCVCVCVQGNDDTAVL